MKKVILFSAVIVFAVLTLVGCTLSGLDLKVDKATTDKNVNVAPLQPK